MQKVKRPAWLDVAYAEMGIAQYPLGSSNTRITQHHDTTCIAGYDDKAPWCSSFISWCLKQCNIEGTHSGLARSWLDWGRPLDSPQLGCIAIITRGDAKSWKGHVGFYLGSNELSVMLLGGNQVLDGNQLGSVCEKAYNIEYNIEKLLSYRWPSHAL